MLLSLACKYEVAYHTNFRIRSPDTHFRVWNLTTNSSRKYRLCLLGIRSGDCSRKEVPQALPLNQFHFGSKGWQDAQALYCECGHALLDTFLTFLDIDKHLGDHPLTLRVLHPILLYILPNIPFLEGRTQSTDTQRWVLGIAIITDAAQPSGPNRSILTQLTFPILVATDDHSDLPIKVPPFTTPQEGAWFTDGSAILCSNAWFGCDNTVYTTDGQIVMASCHGTAQTAKTPGPLLSHLLLCPYHLARGLFFYVHLVALPLGKCAPSTHLPQK